MIKCPACGHDNVDGTMFCEMCGEEVASDGGAGTPTADAGTDGGDIKCPACENMNPPENVVCEVCGTTLRDMDAEVEADPAAVADSPAAGTPAVDATVADTSNPDIPVAAAPDTDATVTVSDDTASTPAPDDTSGAAAGASAAPSAAMQPGQVKLVVEQGMTVGKQFVLGDAEMLVGREDAEDDVYPDIDLADQDEGFVHRKHATLKFENDQLFVTHLGGANKTRLNNRPIPDDEAQPVKLGDKLAFGKVLLRAVANS